MHLPTMGFISRLKLREKLNRNKIDLKKREFNEEFRSNNLWIKSDNVSAKPKKLRKRLSC